MNSSGYSGRRRRRGQSLVEIALALPIFLICLGGIIEAARITATRAALQRVANTAANFGTSTLVDQQIPTVSDISTKIREAAMPPLAKSDIVIDVVNTDYNVNDLRSLRIRLTYEMELIVPIISTLLGGSGGTREVAAVAILPYQGNLPSSSDDAGQIPDEEEEEEDPPAEETPPQFTIQDNGRIVANEELDLTMTALGEDATCRKGNKDKDTSVYGGYRVNGYGDWIEMNGGSTLSGGEELEVTAFPADSYVEFQGKSVLQGCANTIYQSGESDPQVVVIRDGESLPDVPAFTAGTGLQDYLSAYVDTSTGKAVLGEGQALVLYEFEVDAGDAAADFQDLALLIEWSK